MARRAAPGAGRTAPVEPLESRTLLAGNGLQAEYFDNPNFTGDSYRRIDAVVNFDWGKGSPMVGIAKDTFSVRWTGQLIAPVSGTYKFHTRADDGVRLWIDGELVIDDWAVHPTTESSASVTLTRGRPVDLRLEYFDNTDSAVVMLAWTPPGANKQLIPKLRLYSSAALAAVDAKPAPTGADPVPGTTTAPPASPGGLAAVAESSGNVLLTWNDRSGREIGHRIEKKRGNTGSWTFVANLGRNVTSFVDTRANPSTVYTYRIRANGDPTHSAWTVSARIKTPAELAMPPAPPPVAEPGRPAAPLNLRAVAVSPNRVDLSWTDSASDEYGFAIERSTNGGASWAQLTTVDANVTSYADTTVGPATNYAYRVRAFNALGGSPYSAPASIATPLVSVSAPPTSSPPAQSPGRPNGPSQLVATALSTTSVRVTWVDNSGSELGYVLERKRGVTGSWLHAASLPANATQFTDEGLDPGTNYTYRARAYNAAGDSNYSNEAPVQTHSLASAPPGSQPPVSSGPLTPLRVSSNGRYLVDASGKPFFWLADTAWELFHRLSRSEADHYLTTRAAQGFNVIQAVAVAELDGFNSPNAQGDRPFVSGNPAAPDVTGGSNPASAHEYDYWDHVDYVIARARELGMYTALLPTWGSHVQSGAISESAAEANGRFLGQRYRNEPIIWVLGGDRQPYGRENVWRALARGIAIGVSGSEDYSRVLMTYHAPDGDSSAFYFHNEPWLDFNMLQSGHSYRDLPNYNLILNDYNRSNAKPTLDAEPRYESSPVGFSVANGRFDAFDVRQAAYWSVFAGAMGHTYGHHSIWQMYASGRTGYVAPDQTWMQALTAEGAQDMVHLRRLIESRPMGSRRPDQGLVADAYSGADHLQATRGDDYALIYTPTGRSVTVNMGRISGSTVNVAWYDPRTGAWIPVGSYSNSGTRTFSPPTSGRGNDWVLVIDDASRGYGAPR